MKQILYTRNSPRFACFSQPSGIISQDNPPSDFLFSFTDLEGEDTPGFGRSPHPCQVSALLYRARGDDGRARVLGTLFSVPGTSYLRSSTYWLPSRLSPSRDGGCRIRGVRTNGEFDDPNSVGPSAQPDTTRYSNADLGSGEARRSRADRHSRYPSFAAGFRDSLTFLRIGPFADARAFAMRTGWLHVAAAPVADIRTLPRWLQVVVRFDG